MTWLDFIKEILSLLCRMRLNCQSRELTMSLPWCEAALCSVLLCYTHTDSPTDTFTHTGRFSLCELDGFELKHGLISSEQPCPTCFLSDSTPPFRLTDIHHSIGSLH